MSVSNVVTIDGEVEEVEIAMSIDELRNRLIAIGVNNTVGSYNGEEKKMAYDFLSSSLSNSCDLWMFLNQNAKIALIDSHAESFSRWIKNEK